jgi:Dienelactone hydrolase family
MPYLKSVTSGTELTRVRNTSVWREISGRWVVVHNHEDAISSHTRATIEGESRLGCGVFGYEVGMPDTTIPAADGTPLKAYLAIPAEAGPRAGVVVIQDALGLTRAIGEHVDRLASYGYLAVAPDLYARGGMLRCVQATFRSLFSGQGQACDDIETSRRWLLGRGGCSGRVGVIGFCMGGGFALMTANRGFDGEDEEPGATALAAQAGISQPRARRCSITCMT